MVDYATVTDIEDNLKKVDFSATNSSVNVAQVGDMITQESAVIDQYIGVKYDLPIIGDSALSFLEKICISLVVYRVKTILQPKSALPQPDTATAQAIVTSNPYKDAMTMLKDISKGKTPLPGESTKNIKYFSSSSVNNDTQTAFDSQEQQW